MSGNLLLTTDLDGKSVTTPAVLLVDFPDRLRLELQDPVGGLLALLVVNGERFWLYRRDRTELLTGPLSRMPAGLLPFSTRAEDVVRIFLARPEAGHLHAATLASDRATYRAGSRTETILWDGSLPEPSEWRQSEAGAGAASALYENYEFKDGLRYPSRIKLASQARGGARSDLTLAWKDWEPSVPKEKKLFQIPQPETFGRKIKELR